MGNDAHQTDPQKIPPSQRKPWWPYDRRMNDEELDRFLAFGQGSGYAGDGIDANPEAVQKRLDTWTLEDAERNTSRRSA